jgi:hypothetical protein
MKTTYTFFALMLSILTIQIASAQSTKKIQQLTNEEVVTFIDIYSAMQLKADSANMTIMYMQILEKNLQKFKHEWEELNHLFDKVKLYMLSKYRYSADEYTLKVYDIKDDEIQIWIVKTIEDE